MQPLDRMHTLCAAILLAFGYAASLGCNDVLGFQEGKPFPDAATVDTSMPDAASTKAPDAGLDAGGTTREAGSGGCQGADAATCTTGESCVNNVCTCNEGTKRCGTKCIPSNQCCDARDCATGGTCQDGMCSCPSDQHECSGHASASSIQKHAAGRARPACLRTAATPHVTEPNAA
jgi:hypothetical protein